MGPSGAGKDTLMAEAKRLLPDGLVLATRLVTRPADGLSPDRFVSEERLRGLIRDGRLALHWRCHGLGYGIERTIDEDLREGQVVLVNGSRDYLRRALALYPGLRPVLVTAEPSVLKARLEKRAREDRDSILGRLLRTDGSFDLDTGGLLVIDNSRSLQGATERFLGHLKGLLAAG
jgi:ribose 1,5-bisphosphokinase